MTRQVRILLMLIVALAVMGLASCDHYVCSSGATFGNSSCTSGTNSNGANAFAYAVNQGGFIDGYTLDVSAGSFAASTNYTAPSVPQNLGSVGAVVAQGKFLYTVFEDLQQIYGWTIDSSGNLTALSPGFPVTIPLAGVPSVLYPQNVVITNPAGTLLFVSDAGASQIFVYAISSAGALSAVTGSPFTVGFEPQNMAMDGQGKYLYVSENNGLSNHESSGVAAFSVTGTGTSTALSLIATYPSIQMWAMQGEPSGQYLIGISGKTTFFSGSSDANIYVFSISGTGTLLAVTNSPFATTNAPFNIAVQPVAGTGGPLIYSFSITSTNTGPNAIEGYQLNPSTGALTAVTVGTAAASWGQFDQSGSFLIGYADQSLSAYEVSSSGGLTEIGAAAPLATTGYWAVTDIP